MKIETLTTISPLDGRYHLVNEDLRDVFSEYGLIKYRIKVEVEWFIHLSKQNNIPELPRLSLKDTLYINDLVNNFTIKEALKIKKIESTTNHDVKAIEYYLKNKFSESTRLKKYLEFIHFACTSEDINNLAYSLMIKDGTDSLIRNKIVKLERLLKEKAKSYSNIPMLSRTHGQSLSLIHI